MSVISRVINISNSLFHRINPALRYSQALVIKSPIKFYISAHCEIKGRINCKKGSLTFAGDAALAKGSSVNVNSGASIIVNTGVRIGKSSQLSAQNNAKLLIGENTTFFSSVLLNGPIVIGMNCLFGPNVTVLTGTHIIKDRRPIRVQDAEYFKKHGKPPSDPVKIGDDCWIGANAVILPGVELGKGCVVGAGAVVTKSFKEYCVIGGVPAKLLNYR